jgi:hypothetical protein
MDRSNCGSHIRPAFEGTKSQLGRCQLVIRSNQEHKRGLARSLVLGFRLVQDRAVESSRCYRRVIAGWVAVLIPAYEIGQMVLG